MACPWLEFADERGKTSPNTSTSAASRGVLNCIPKENRESASGYVSMYLTAVDAPRKMHVNYHAHDRRRQEARRRKRRCCFRKSSTKTQRGDVPKGYC